MRSLLLALPIALVAASCGSTSATLEQTPLGPGTVAQEDSAPEVAQERAIEAPSTGSTAEDPLTPAPWTGAFTETAVMLAGTIYVEGPQGLLEHVAARVDDRVAADAFAWAPTVGRAVCKPRASSYQNRNMYCTGGGKLRTP